MKPTKHEEETSFFKLILSPSSQSKKLRIPNKFAKYVLRDGLYSSVATLKVPTGETRKVEVVEEDNNELWFRDGWQDFFEYFSIQYAYFLMFEYEGGSNFNVHIFDLSACEISYPCNARKSTCLGHDHDQPWNNAVDIDVDDHNKEPEMLLKPSVISSKKSEVHMQVENDVEGEQMNHVAVSGYPSWMKKYEGLIEAAIDAGISLPENNPFFVAAIKPYVLDRGRYLNIPKPFGQKHIGHETKLIKLEGYDGRQWEVRCVVDSTKYSFHGGWSVFSREIGLQVGDICIFELIDANKYVLKIQVAAHKKQPEISIVD